MRTDGSASQASRRPGAWWVLATLANLNTLSCQPFWQPLGFVCPLWTRAGMSTHRSTHVDARYWVNVTYACWPTHSASGEAASDKRLWAPKKEVVLCKINLQWALLDSSTKVNLSLVESCRHSCLCLGKESHHWFPTTLLTSLCLKITSAPLGDCCGFPTSMHNMKMKSYHINWTIKHMSEEWKGDFAQFRDK